MYSTTAYYVVHVLNVCMHAIRMYVCALHMYILNQTCCTCCLPTHPVPLTIYSYTLYHSPSTRTPCTTHHLPPHTQPVPLTIYPPTPYHSPFTPTPCPTHHLPPHPVSVPLTIYPHTLSHSPSTTTPCATHHLPPHPVSVPLTIHFLNHLALESRRAMK